MKTYSIIVAGGIGSRMGFSIPKQFLELNSKPILMHTIECFYKAINNTEIIVALPKTQFEYWEKLCEKHHFDIPHQLSPGGSHRFESVKNALDYVQEKSIVAIHDGVRPLVNKTVIIQCLNKAQKHGNAIPFLSINESLRKIQNNGLSTIVDRDVYKLIQTPQCFKSQLIKQAYQQNYNPLFTDDSSVVEQMGEAIFLVQGNKENIKITTPEDLKIAEYFLSIL